MRTDSSRSVNIDLSTLRCSCAVYPSYSSSQSAPACCHSTLLLICGSELVQGNPHRDTQSDCSQVSALFAPDNSYSELPVSQLSVMRTRQDEGLSRKTLCL